MENYPIRMCETCFHRGVCKWIATFSNMKDVGVPLDLAVASCTLYYSESAMDEEVLGGEVDDENIMDTINLLVDEYYERGLVPEYILMSKQTFEEINSVLTLGRVNNIITVKTRKGDIPIAFSQFVPDGEFRISATM